jgi:hypothetical protein
MKVQWQVTLSQKPAPPQSEQRLLSQDLSKIISIAALVDIHPIAFACIMLKKARSTRYWSLTALWPELK